MKRVWSLLLIASFLCLLVACRKAEKGGEVSSADAETSSVSVASDTESTTASAASGSAAQSSVSSKKSTVSTKPAASKPPANTKAASSSTPAPAPKPASKPAASSAPKPAETAQQWLIGKWSAEMDMSPFMELLGFSSSEPLMIKATMEFKQDGQMHMALDVNHFRTVMQRACVQMLQSQLGPDATVSGVSIEAYVQMQLDGMMDEMQDSSQETGAYKFVGDTLWFKDSTTVDFVQVQYRFTDRNTLTLQDEDGTFTLKRIA